MRFIEIANAEDKLALWKLVTDKMWSAFGQQAQQQNVPEPIYKVARTTPKAVAMAMTPSKAKPQNKKQSASAKVARPKKAPTAPRPKPLPKPNPQQVTSTQATKQLAQQHQQLAKQLHKELMKPNPQQRIYPQPPTPIQKSMTPIEPLNNSYDERYMDELVMHSRAQHPFKTISQIKNG
jgi:hypothetical protein